MKPIVFLVAAAALVLAPPAAAKEGGAGYEVCGPDACASIDHGSDSVVILDSGSESPPPPPGPYYRIDYKEQHAVPYYFRPDRQLVGAKLGTNGEISWYRIDGTSALHRLNAATAKLEPYAVASTSGGTAPDTGIDWRPWALAAGLVLLALAAGGFLARRMRVRRPTTA
jgi:hypothetical protein